MARRPRTNISASAKWIAGVLVCVLVIATIVLVVLAVQRTSPTDPAEQPEPVPTFTFAAPASPASAPAPSASASAAPPAAGADAGAASRFLSIGSGGMWRGTAGDCADVAPTIERSADGGQTWEDVTPTYRDIGRLVSLEAFAQTEAEIVASMGANCETQALRTFTQGEFWQPYDDVLAASRYVDPADPATVVTPRGRIPAPCPNPASFRAQGEAVALVCEGTAYGLTDGAWSPLAIPDVVALAAASGDVVLASTAPGCGGITVTRAAGTATESTSCVADADPSAPLAIAATATEILLWSGDSLLTSG